MPIGACPVTVCPVCEDNHVAPAMTQAMLGEWRATVDAHACAQYAYAFVSQDDATHLVRQLAAVLGCEPPQVSTRLLEKRDTAFRTDSGIEDVVPPLVYWLRHWSFDRLLTPRRPVPANAETSSTSGSQTTEANALLGFARSLSTPDQAHHLSTVREEYVLAGDDGVFGWTVEGENQLPTPSASYPVRVYGDNAMSVSGVPIIAFGDLTSDQELPIDCTDDAPHCKTYTVGFHEPVPPGGSFRVDVRCLWKGAFPRSQEHSYVVLPWGAQAAHGPDRLVGRLVSDTPIDEVTLVAADPAHPDTPDQAMPVSRTERGEWLVEWDLKAPHALSVLTFRRNFHEARS